MDKSTMRNKKGQYLPGHKLTPRKRIPLSLRREADAYRLSIIKDLGGESNISTTKLLLISKAMNLWTVTRAIEDFVNANGAFRGKILEPVLAENYVTFCNSFRLCLDKIGFEQHRAESFKTVPQLMREFDEDKARKEEEAGKEEAKKKSKTRSERMRQRLQPDILPEIIEGSHSE